ncbi:hypothetical protein WMF11_41810 [Sorangium sp. So ce295]|uniref:DUF6968 family protein n=1 Tax=Sorangium sp. So ce295 TaxID=3133295 RepID=UPI003F6317B9
MQDDTPLEPIAERRLSVVGEPGRMVTVTIGKPVQKASGDWACPVEIQGIPDPVRDSAYGSRASAARAVTDCPAARRTGATASRRLSPIASPMLRPLIPRGAGPDKEAYFYRDKGVPALTREEIHALRGKIELLRATQSRWQALRIQGQTNALRRRTVFSHLKRRFVAISTPLTLCGSRTYGPCMRVVEPSLHGCLTLGGTTPAAEGLRAVPAAVREQAALLRQDAR